MITSLLCMSNYIKNRSVITSQVNSINQLEGFEQAAWQFISAIYKAKWHALKTEENSKMFRQNVISKFNPKKFGNKMEKK